MNVNLVLDSRNISVNSAEGLKIVSDGVYIEVAFG